MNHLTNKTLVTFAFIALFCVSLGAQVNGTVTDEYGRVLQGVMVKSGPGDNGTMTDYNGQYELLIDDGSTEVIFSLEGYITQTVNVEGATLDVVLPRAETYNLDETVIFGNYTQREGDITGSVARVTERSSEVTGGQSLHVPHRATTGTVYTGNLLGTRSNGY